MFDSPAVMITHSSISIQLAYDKLGNKIPVSSIQASRVNESNLVELFEFNKLFVPKELRGNGTATQLMQKFVEILDENAITMLCEAVPYDDGLDKDELIRFYKKFDFEDYNERLIRFPKRE